MCVKERNLISMQATIEMLSLPFQFQVTRRWRKRISYSLNITNEIQMKYGNAMQPKSQIHNIRNFPNKVKAEDPQLEPEPENNVSTIHDKSSQVHQRTDKEIHFQNI